MRKTAINTSRHTCCLILLLLVALWPAHDALAQNWFKLQGTESAGAKNVHLWGFLQPAYYYSESNTQPYADFRKNNFNIRRARIGIRGVIPGTDEKVNYFLLTEWGRNGITQDPNGNESNFAALTDASVTLNYIPGARIRVGQFKTPVGIDGLKAIQIHEFVEFAQVFDQLMLERFGLNRSVGAFRDIGIQLFDWWKIGKASRYEFSYAFMLGNGNGINSRDNNSQKNFTGKIVLARIFDHSTGPRRHNIKLGLWYMSGQRKGYTFDTASGGNGAVVERTRTRYGADFTFSNQYKGAGLIRFAAEAVWGKGWVLAPGYFDGAIPASKRYFTYNQSVDGHGVPHADLDAAGWYVSMGYRPPGLEKRLEINARYDHYDPDASGNLDQNLSQDNWTVNGQLFFSPAVRLTVGYMFKDSRWNSGVGNQFAAQVTAIFK